MPAKPTTPARKQWQRAAALAASDAAADMLKYAQWLEQLARADGPDLRRHLLELAASLASYSGEYLAAGIAYEAGVMDDDTAARIAGGE